MQNRVYNTRAVVEAGLISALIVIITLFNAYIPMFSQIGIFALPIPVTILYIRHGYKVSLGAVVASGILVAFLFDPIKAISSITICGMSGITLGYCVKKDKNFPTTILLLSIASAISTIIAFMITVTFIDKGGAMHFLEQNIKILNETFDQTAGIYTKMGLTEEQLKPILQMKSLFTKEVMLMVLPGVVVFASVISAFINYSITKVILKKLKYNMRDITPLSEVYISSTFAFFIVVPMIIGIALNGINKTLANYILSSGLTILQGVFLLVGMSVVMFFLKNRFRLSKAIITLIIVFTIFNPLFGNVYLIIGLADMIMDFRKINPNRIFKR